MGTLKSDPPTTTALVARDSAPRSEDKALQRLWLALTRREWKSLAIIGGSESLPTLDVANLLAKMAWWYRGQSSFVFDFRDVGIRLMEHQMQELKDLLTEGDRAFIALRSVFENPTAIVIAQNVDAVVLCVGMGKTAVTSAEKTLDEIGRERFIGSIILDGAMLKKAGK